MSETLELEKRVEFLEKDNLDLQTERDALLETCEELRADIRNVERELTDALNADADLDTVTDNEVLKEFMRRNSIELTMVNEMKTEAVFGNWDKFTTEQFEEFIKGLK